MANKNSFWNLPKHSKLDILREGEFNHSEVIIRALADEETNVEFIDKDTYSIYGTEEGLLIQAVSPVFRIGLLLYCSMLAFLHGELAVNKN
jgi:hypothetical protein